MPRWPNDAPSTGPVWPPGGLQEGMNGPSSVFYLTRCHPNDILTLEQSFKCMNDNPIPACQDADHQAAQRLPPVRREALERAAGIFRALGDVSRLRLLALLGQGEACVSELASAEHEDLSTISQRLRVLRSEDLVVRRRRGKHINYSLKDQHIVEMLFNALAHASEQPPSLSSTTDSKGHTTHE